MCEPVTLPLAGPVAAIANVLPEPLCEGPESFFSTAVQEGSAKRLAWEKNPFAIPAQKALWGTYHGVLALLGPAFHWHVWEFGWRPLS